MKAKSIIALAGLILVMMMSCAEHTIDPVAEYADGRVDGTIHGIVMGFTDNVTFEPQDVQVSWVSNDSVHTKNLDTLSYYIIPDLSPGYYDLTFRGPEGYCDAKIERVYVPTLEEVNDGSYATEKDYAQMVERNIWLYEKNASIKGHVEAQHADGTSEPAVGAEVFADYSMVTYVNPSGSIQEDYQLLPDRFPWDANNNEVAPVVVDANGDFEITDLPNAAVLAVTVNPLKIGGRDYKMTSTNVELADADTTVMDGNIEMELAGDKPYLLSSNFANNTAFPVQGTLTMTFDRAMNTDDFLVELKNGNTQIDIDATWMNNTLEVNPVEALDYGTEYTLRLMGEALTEGTSYDDNGAPVEFMFVTLDKHPVYVLETNFYDIQHKTHVGDFELAGNLTAEFSKAIDINRNFTAVLYEDKNGNETYQAGTDEEIETAVTWSTDSKTVTLDPTLDLTTDSKYYVTFAGWATDSMALEMPDLDDNAATDEDLFFETIEGIKFISTSLENAQGEYEDVPIKSTDGVGPQIEVIFSRQIDLNNDKTVITLESEAGYDVRFNVIAINETNPIRYGFAMTPENELEPNQDYALVYDVYSTIPGDHADMSEHPNATVRAAGELVFTTELLATLPAKPANEFRLNVNADQIDYTGWVGGGQGQIPLEWQPAKGVDDYLIYAKDSYLNTDMILVATVGARPDLIEQTAVIQLPAEFDLYANDGMQTPFADTIKVTLGLVAKNDAGVSAMRGIRGTTVQDKRAPVATVNWGGASFNRTGAGQGDQWNTVTVTTDRGEYLDDAYTGLTFTDNDNTVNSNWSTADDFRNFELSNDRTQITFEVQAEGGLDRSGDRIEITIYDTSGNAELISELLP